jgi:hypothetical protein
MMEYSLEGVSEERNVLIFRAELTLKMEAV